MCGVWVDLFTSSALLPAPASQLLWGSYPMQHPDTLSYPLSQKVTPRHIVTEIRTQISRILGNTCSSSVPICKFSWFSFSFSFKPDIISFDKTLNKNRKCLVFSQKGSSGSGCKWWKPQHFRALFTGEEVNTDLSQRGCHFPKSSHFPLNFTQLPFILFFSVQSPTSHCYLQSMPHPEILTDHQEGILHLLKIRHGSQKLQSSKTSTTINILP